MMMNIVCLIIFASITLISLSGCRYTHIPADTRIEDSITRGIRYLIDNQNDDGSISLSNDETFKVWETGNTILVIHTVNEGEEQFLKKATGYLLSVQRNDGSFSYSGEAIYCAETTAVCLLALALNGENVSTGISFILNTQSPNGSWEIGIPGIKDRFFPSITGLELVTLMCLGIFNENVSSGIEYVQESQLEDGSWGTSWEYYDTPYYATYPNLLALKLYGLETSDSYKRAVRYIKQNQNQDGSWGRQIPDRPSKALRTSLALNSLLISPNNSDLSSVERGINWLIENQSDDGHWDGGYFVGFNLKKEDIYATNMAVLALKRYLCFKNDEPLLCPNCGND